MDILMIVGQEKDGYPGEHAPAALEVISEYDNDDNPDFLKVKMAEYQTSRDWENLILDDADDTYQIVRSEIIQEQTILIREQDQIKFGLKE